MKTNKIITLLLVAIASISFTSCVEDGDFTVPQALGSEENAAVEQIKADLTAGSLTEISIANLKGLVVNGQATEITSDIVVKGYVTSSDASGNFFKEFFIQDKAENPTAAIKVVTELTDTYNKFNFGREMYIKLKGLYVGETRSGDGVAAIGGSQNAAGDEVENLSLNQTEQNVFRSGTTETSVPLNVTFSQINGD